MLQPHTLFSWQHVLREEGGLHIFSLLSRNHNRNIYTELGILQIYAYSCEWIPDFTKASKRISVELGVKYIEGRGRIAGRVCISRAMNAPGTSAQASKLYRHIVVLISMSDNIWVG